MTHLFFPWNSLLFTILCGFLGEIDPTSLALIWEDFGEVIWIEEEVHQVQEAKEAKEEPNGENPSNHLPSNATATSW